MPDKSKLHTPTGDLQKNLDNNASTFKKKSKINSVFENFDNAIDTVNKNYSLKERLNNGVNNVLHIMRAIYDKIYNDTFDLFDKINETRIIRRIKKAFTVSAFVGLGFIGSSSQQQVNFNPLVRETAPQLNYRVGINDIKRIDEYGQLGLVYKNDTHEMKYQIVAIPLPKTDVANHNRDWIAYELNGLTNKGTWYQCSIEYRANQGFGLLYMIWGGKNSCSEKWVSFNGTVNANDKIDISMNIRNGIVSMHANDINTGSIAKKSFHDPANIFVGRKIPNGMYTGLMTEFDKHTDKINLNPVPLYGYINMSNKPIKFYEAFDVFQLFIDKHMHDIHFLKDGKVIQYYPKVINLANNTVKINSNSTSDKSNEDNFDLNLKHFEFKSNGNIIFIGPHRDQ